VELLKYLIVREDGMTSEGIWAINIFLWSFLFVVLVIHVSMWKMGAYKEWYKEIFRDDLIEPTVRDRLSYFALVTLGSVLVYYLIF